MDAIPIWALFTITIVLVVIAIEAGYRLGHNVQKRYGDEKDSPVSTIGAAVLGLLAFILAFTFGTVTDRYHELKEAIDESERIQSQLWKMAVVNARLDMKSDIGSLYIESLNEVINFHALRKDIGLYTRIPVIIWIVLYALIILAMLGIGYHTAISGSRRSWAMLILALSFSIVITLIALLDNPQRGIIRVSQQPLIELQTEMKADM